MLKEPWINTELALQSCRGHRKWCLCCMHPLPTINAFLPAKEARAMPLHVTVLQGPPTCWCAGKHPNIGQQHMHKKRGNTHGTRHRFRMGCTNASFPVCAHHLACRMDQYRGDPSQILPTYAQ
jgi:hypothetical protein